MKPAALLIALVACGAPPLSIELAVDPDTCPAGSGSNACEGVLIPCASMMLLRVVDPAQPTTAYISACQRVVLEGQPDLCSLAGVPIDAAALPASLPERTLEVEVLVLPLALGSDGEPDCSAYLANLPFTSTCVLQSTENAPPIGGCGFYHPGDASTVVRLGCNDLSILDQPTCAGSGVGLDASVVELDTQLAVTGEVADTLDVSAGEPTELGGTYVLKPEALTELTRAAASGPPQWIGTVPPPVAAECLRVDEEVSQSTPTLVCEPAGSDTTQISLAGMHVTRERLAQIVSAIQAVQPGFVLDDGLVIGVALDNLSSPAAGEVVTPSTSGTTVLYLSADGTSISGSATSSSGIFLSTNAPFLTSWSTLQEQAFGGLVEDHVTVVVLQTSQHE